MGEQIRPLLILPINRCFKDQIPMCFINSWRIYLPENPKVVIIEYYSTKPIIPNFNLQKISVNKSNQPNQPNQWSMVSYKSYNKK